MTGILLHPLPPYDFHASALIFAGGDPAIRTYRDGVFSMALEAGGIPVLIALHSSGTASRPLLHLEIRGAEPVSPALAKTVRDMVGYMFSLQEDLVPMYHDPGWEPVPPDSLQRSS